MDSDQHDTIITDMDLRSTRRDENTGNAAPERREHELNDADLRSTRMQRDINSAETEQLPGQQAGITADTDFRSTRPQQCTGSEDDEMNPRVFPKHGITIFQILGRMIQSCSMYLTKKMMIHL